MNKAIIKGRLTRDPDTKSTQSGKLYTRFTVAVDRPTKGEKKTDFIPCLAWEKTADMVEKYFCKGKEILVEGRIQTDSYEAKDGTKRTKTEIAVERVYFCGSKSDGETAARTTDETDPIPF